MQIVHVHVSQGQTKDCHVKGELAVSMYQEKDGVITDLDHCLEVFSH